MFICNIINWCVCHCHSLTPTILQQLRMTNALAYHTTKLLTGVKKFYETIYKCQLLMHLVTEVGLYCQ